MKTVLIIEDDQASRVALSACLKASGFDVLAVAGDEASARTLVAAGPDAFVFGLTDQRPHVLLFAEEIRRTRRYGRAPFVLLNGLRDADLQRRAGALRPVGVFEKPFDLRDLLALISRTTAGRQELTAADLSIKLVAASGESGAFSFAEPMKTFRDLTLPSHPATIARFRRLLDDCGVEFDEVVDVVGSDPATTAAVLRAANEEPGLKGTVFTLRRAVMILGISHVRGMLRRARAVEDPAELEAADPRRIGGYWFRARRAAVAARRFLPLVRQRITASPDEVYLVALLRDVGLLVLLEMDRVRLLAASFAVRREVHFLAKQRRLLGVDHAAVGRSLARTWGLPSTIAAAAGRDAGESPWGRTEVLTGLVEMSEFVAEALRGPADVPRVAADLMGRSDFHFPDGGWETELEDLAAEWVDGVRAGRASPF